MADIPDSILDSPMFKGMSMIHFSPQTNGLQLMLCREGSQQIYKPIHDDIRADIKTTLSKMFPRKSFNIQVVVSDPGCSEVWWAGDYGTMFVPIMKGDSPSAARPGGDIPLHFVDRVSDDSGLVGISDPRIATLKDVEAAVIAAAYQKIDTSSTSYSKISRKGLVIKLWMFDKEDTTHRYASNKAIEAVMLKDIDRHLEYVKKYPPTDFIRNTTPTSIDGVLHVIQASDYNILREMGGAFY